jgi:DNA-binding NarL/FixJ family response regulator
MESKPLIRIAVVESDPVRLMGYHALFESEPGFDVVWSPLSEISRLESNGVVLLGSCPHNLFDSIASIKAIRPDLRIIVTGSGAEEMILNSLVAGAKGYVDKTALPAEFLQAVRVVSQGLLWAPRHVFTLFIERSSSALGRMFPSGSATLTSREKDVLELLVGGRSNKEIGSPLGIQERTVKAHVAKLMRKVGVHNRIALSVHALTHSLVRIETPPILSVKSGRDSGR